MSQKKYKKKSLKQQPQVDQPVATTAKEQRRPVTPLIKICLIFFGIVLGFNLIEWLVMKPWQVEMIQLFTAKVSAAVIGLTGINISIQGTHMFFPGGHWEIVSECTALNAFYVFIAFLIAYPSTLKAKGIGAAIGIPFLFVANIFRLLVLAWAIQIFPNYAEMVHDYVWQIAFLFLLLMMWLAWIDFVVKNEKISELPA